MGLKKSYLVITELFMPTKGGTAVWFDEVYRLIGRKNIHIVTADVEGAQESDEKSVNTVHRVNLKRHWWLRPESLAVYVKLFIRSLFTGIRHTFDAVHAGRVLPEGLVALIVARLIRKPVMIYAHGEEITTWSRSKRRRPMIFTYRHADMVIANSDFTRDKLLDLGVRDECISIISPGVDLERFKPITDQYFRNKLGLSDGQKLILSVGRLSRRKGFDHVIQSLPGLIKDGIDAHYAIVGVGGDREYLEKLVESNEVQGRVHFLGHVVPEELPLCYNAADVVVMVNREIDGDTEGFGMVFIEAAACGKPVIAGKAGGTGSAVLDGQTGLRVDGDFIQEIQNALKSILGDSKKAQALGDNGYNRARKEFGWEHVARKTVDVSDSLKSH